MILSFLDTLQNYLRVINQILAAGIAITALALLLYALSFNLRDRVARSFALILISVGIVFASDAVGSVTSSEQEIVLWFHIQWIGIIWLPATYLQFSHALLITTGATQKGWRNILVKISYLISFVFMASLPYSSLVGAVVIDQKPAPYLQPSQLTYIFTAYYFGTMILAWVNFVITYRRTTTPTSQRRMAYLIIGALAPALGSFPYLLFGSSFAADHSLTFWLLSVFINLSVGGLIVIMAYTVAFFGVSWPDRIVRSRLFKWILRGPITAIITLALVTIVRRMGERYGVGYSAFVPITMIVSILLLEFTITIFGTIWQKWLFPARDREDLEVLHSLESYLLTRNDLNQFLEMILAAVCDRLQVSGAYIATIRNNELDQIIHAGEGNSNIETAGDDLLRIVTNNHDSPSMFQYGNDSLLVIQQETEMQAQEMLGILGITDLNGENLDPEQRKDLILLVQRAALALRDRRTQETVLQSIQTLTPQMEMFQQVRAASRFDRNSLLSESIPSVSEDMVVWVKDALGHYWGGPKLSKSPLLQLNIVKNTFHLHNGNSVNALRAILRDSIERVRPEGERHFTAEWILYNILEMKFLEGKKVREIALRLAMSEADLYRKQRIAIEAVAKEILKMEAEATIAAAENPA